MDIAIGTPVNPTTQSSGVFKWAGGEGTRLIAINESFNNLYILFGGGQKSYVPANDRRLYILKGIMAQSAGQAQWVVQSGINDLNTVNQLIIEVYAPGEELPEIYPTPLIRQMNVSS